MSSRALVAVLVAAAGCGRASTPVSPSPPVVTVSQPPAPATGLNSFMRDYIEALFLGTGVLTPTDGVRGCPRSFGTWQGFPAGTAVQVVVSSSVPVASANALATAVTTVSSASAGSLSATISQTTDANPMPSINQVSATLHSNPQSLGCGFPQGCTIFNFVPGTAFTQSARSILVTGQTPAAFVHDAVGHGVMGLCHVDGNLIGGPGLSLMSYGPGIFSNQLPTQLSAYDLVATRAVFSSGLTVGATREDFLRMGLVNATDASTAAVPNVRVMNRSSQVGATAIR